MLHQSGFPQIRHGVLLDARWYPVIITIFRSFPPLFYFVVFAIQILLDLLRFWMSKNLQGNPGSRNQSRRHILLTKYAVKKQMFFTSASPKNKLTIEPKNKQPRNAQIRDGVFSGLVRENIFGGIKSKFGKKKSADFEYSFMIRALYFTNARILVVAVTILIFHLHNDRGVPASIDFRNI